MRADKGHIGFHKVAPSGYVPLYTAPPKKDEPVIDKSMAKRIATQLGWEPKKEWVNLTVEERETLRDAYQDSFSGLISAVQMLLKEKNT